MRRIIGIVIFAVGILLILSVFLRIMPGGAVWINTGFLAVVAGAAVFGLSFVKPPQPEADAPPPLPPAERIAGVFYEPARIFQNLRHHPRWLAAFLVVALSAVLYQVAFVQRVTPDAIAQVMSTQFDKLVESGWMSSEKAQIAKEQTLVSVKSPAGRVAGALNTIGGSFLLMLAAAGIFLLCVVMFGGRMNFWQALSVAAYSTLPPFVIQYLLSIVLLYVKPLDQIEPLKDQSGLVRADLSLPFTPADHPFLYVAGMFIGVLSLYRLWLTATGLRETGWRLSNGSAWTIALALGTIYLLFALALAAIFPSFVS